MRREDGACEKKRSGYLEWPCGGWWAPQLLSSHLICSSWHVSPLQALIPGELVSGLLNILKLMNTKAQSNLVHHWVARQQSKWRGLCHTHLLLNPPVPSPWQLNPSFGWTWIPLLLDLLVKIKWMILVHCVSGFSQPGVLLKNSEHCTLTEDLSHGVDIGAYSNCLSATERKPVRFTRNSHSLKRMDELWGRLTQKHRTVEWMLDEDHSPYQSVSLVITYLF